MITNIFELDDKRRRHHDAPEESGALTAPDLKGGGKIYPKEAAIIPGTRFTKGY